MCVKHRLVKEEFLYLGCWFSYPPLSSSPVSLLPCVQDPAPPHTWFSCCFHSSSKKTKFRLPHCICTLDQFSIPSLAPDLIHISIPINCILKKLRNEGNFCYISLYIYLTQYSLLKIVQFFLVLPLLFVRQLSWWQILKVFFFKSERYFILLLFLKDSNMYTIM